VPTILDPGTVFSTALAETTVALIVAPELTVTVPPLLMVELVNVPPLTTVIEAPLTSVIPEAVAPLETVSVSPLTSVGGVAVPPVAPLVL
jgi:hypothetical protein